MVDLGVKFLFISVQDSDSLRYPGITKVNGSEQCLWAESKFFTDDVYLDCCLLTLSYSFLPLL